jgi:hypothetical protein
MKKLSVLAVWAVGFIFIAAPIYVKNETRGLTINGKSNPFGQAMLINGNTWAIPVDQFTRGFGGNLNMEQAGFTIKGNSLWTLTSNDQTADKRRIDQTAIKGKTISGGAFFVRKAGEKIGDLIPFNGQRYIAVNDVARAFKPTFTAITGNLAPGQSLTLNFAVNGDGILGVR